METKFQAGAKELWIGRHSVDDDTLVFDPAVAQSSSGNVTFFSLSRLGTRSFTPGSVQQLITGITDPKELSALKKTYKRWPELKVERDEIDSQARSDAMQQRRSTIAERHRDFLAALPTQDASTVGKPTASPKRRRIANCPVCHRTLDTGMNLECDDCAQRVCTCGACNCGVLRPVQA